MAYFGSKQATPAQRRAAQLKAAQTAAFNRANGILSVHAQRALKKAQANGQPPPATKTRRRRRHYAPPPSTPSAAPPPYSPPPAAAYVPPAPTPGGPMRLQRKPITPLKDMQLAALAQLEDIVKFRYGTPATQTKEAVDTFDKYDKCKALALNNTADHEAQSALKRATIELVKLAFA